MLTTTATDVLLNITMVFMMSVFDDNDGYADDRVVMMILARTGLGSDFNAYDFCPN